MVGKDLIFVDIRVKVVIMRPLSNGKQRMERIMCRWTPSHNGIKVAETNKRVEQFLL